MTINGRHTPHTIGMVTACDSTTAIDPPISKASASTCASSTHVAFKGAAERRIHQVPITPLMMKARTASAPATHKKSPTCVRSIAREWAGAGEVDVCDGELLESGARG